MVADVEEGDLSGELGEFFPDLQVDFGSRIEMLDCSTFCSLG